jgi:hypothetical protein
MDDAMCVGIAERVGDFAGNACCVCYRKGSRTEQPLAKGFPFDEWHDVIEDLAVGGRVVERQNVRVGEASGDLNFAQEALLSEADRYFRPQHFDCDGAMMALVLGLKNGSHATAAKLALQCVASCQDGAWSYEHPLHEP